jgi:type VI secretion system secreted protein VgrG
MSTSLEVNPYTFTVDGFADDALRVVSFSGTERMSHAYAFEIEVATNAGNLDEIERAALGQRAVFTWMVGTAPRCFYGVIGAVALGSGAASHAFRYRLRLVPRLWLLRRKRKTRVFQNLRVPDVVTAVLLEGGIAARWQLTRAYPVREYCTQYEETDYRFVTRLLAEAGIYFYFAEGGPVDPALLTAGDIAAAAGSAGGSLLGSVAGSAGRAAGSLVGSAVSAAAPLVPGDTVICGDDASFYPPIGGDDPAELAAATAAALAPEVGQAIGDAAGGLGAGAAVVGAASAAAGTAIALLAKSPAPTLEFLEVAGLGAAIARLDKVTRFDMRTTVRSNQSHFRDYDPERPLFNPESLALGNDPFPDDALQAIAEAATTAGSALGQIAPGPVGDVGTAVAANAGTVATAIGGLAGEHPPPLLPIYDHHGPFLFPKWDFASDEAPRMLRQARRRTWLGTGQSGCPALGAGHRFALADHPVSRLDREYVLSRVEHRGRALAADGQSGPWSVYENSFVVAPASLTFVPRRPKRRSVQVALTATVVGPKGEEIYVDVMGQIKVQFHWDREGKRDEKSSCWIRTMHPWGGAGWGAQFIPRVGMEVVVVFEGGDPDKPMVIGSLYNGTHPLPFTVPMNKTRSGWRTSSTPGGKGYNELSFDDAVHAEQVFLHAQKNFDEVVENNHTLRVENNELITIMGSRIEAIEKSLQAHVKGDASHIVDGHRTDLVKGNDERRVSGMLATRVEGRERRDVDGLADLVFNSDLTMRVLGCSTTVVGKNDKKRSWTTHAEGSASLSALDHLELSSDGELVLRVGESSIRMTKDRIELSSPTIASSGEAGKLSLGKDGLAMKSSDTQLTLGEKIVMKSLQASLVMGDEMQLDGKKILLNSPGSASDEPPKEPEPPTSVALTDQDGTPVPFQRFVAQLENGSHVGGKTDKDGKAELEIPCGGTIVFPDLTLANEPRQGDLRPYVVRQGDYLDKLAFVHGFDADKAWNDGKNAELKDKRKDPNILHPGDIVHFPRAQREGEMLEKGSSNAYTVNIPRRKVTLRLTDARLAGAKYTVAGAGAGNEGVTDPQGELSIEVPVHQREVLIEFPEKNIACSVRVGGLDPVEETTGARRRLEHLGYRRPSDANETEAEAAEADRVAIANFQRAQGLEPTGVMDDATRAALLAAHGS